MLGETQETGAGPAPVGRRRVMFISGFDPRGPRQYYELWNAEAPKAAAAAGADTHYVQGIRKPRGPLLVQWNWTGTTTIDGQEARTETRFDFLRWDDVARAMWPWPSWSLVRHTAKTLYRGVVLGYFMRILRVRPLYMLTIFQPVCVLAAILLGFPLLVVALLGLVLSLVGVSPLYGLIGAPLGLFAFLPSLRWLQRHSTVLWRGQLNNLFAWLILREAPKLDARVDRMAAMIADAAAEGGVDEFLVIGHSVGSTIAVSALARALKQRPEAFAALPRLGLVTLGSMTPLMAAEPRAAWFREEVVRVALDPAVTWVDITAPFDAASFPLTDPFPLTGRERPPGARVNPQLITPRFHALFDKADYARLKRDRMQMHTQYLMATPRIGRGDFFRLVAGPLALADRFPDTGAQSRGS